MHTLGEWACCCVCSPKQKHYHKPASQNQPLMNDATPKKPGLPDTANIPVPSCPPPPRAPGSLFIWGHRNVNSLSLSISEKTKRWPTLPHKKVAGQSRAERSSTAWDAWSLKSSPPAADSESGVCPALNAADGRRGCVRELYCCRMCALVWQLWYVGEELYPTTHRRLQEMPLKDPLSFTQPRTSTACFIFKAYPVTKDTLVLHLDYMWTSVSSCMEGGLTCRWAAPRHHYALHAF